MTQIVVREPESQEEFQAYFYLRWEVLREPLGQPCGTEKDEKDDGAIHIAAFLDSDVVGVGRLHLNNSKEAQIRWMAVVPEFQKQGIGSKILEKLEEAARLLGASRIVLDAREQVVGFYESKAYEVVFDFRSPRTNLSCKRMQKQSLERQ